MNDNYITLTIGKKKNIALIAHDNKKADLIEWCEQNKDILTQHFLCGTGTKSILPSTIFAPICWSPPRGPLLYPLTGSPVLSVIILAVVPVPHKKCCVRMSFSARTIRSDLPFYYHAR